MTADIKGMIENNDANGAVTAILQSPDLTWATNVSQVIEQGMNSSDPELKQAAEFLRQSLVSSVEKEKMEITAGGRSNDWGDIIKQIAGNDGFQFSDLMKADWSQILGKVVNNLFNLEGSGDQAAIASQRESANNAFRSAQAILARTTSAEGVEMRDKLGGANLSGVNELVQQIDRVAPTPS